MIAQPTKCPQLVDSSNQQKIGKNWIIAGPTKCTQLEGSSNQPGIAKSWMIAQPTKCPQLEGSRKQKKKGENSRLPNRQNAPN